MNMRLARLQILCLLVCCALMPSPARGAQGAAGGADG